MKLNGPVNTHTLPNSEKLDKLKELNLNKLKANEAYQYMNQERLKSDEINKPNGHVNTHTLSNSEILDRLKKLNLNKLKAKEVRQYTSQEGLKSDEINNIRDGIVRDFNNHIVSPIIEHLKLIYANSVKRHQFQGLLDAFITLNVFANLILREGYTFNEKNQFEGMVEDFCEQFNLLLATNPEEHLNKDELIKQIAVLNTHSHDQKPTEAFKRIKAQIMGQTNYNKKEFLNWKTWISGADKDSDFTDPLKRLIIEIDKVLQKKDLVDESQSKLLPIISKNSKLLLSMSSEFKGDLARRLRIYNQLGMAGITDPVSREIIVGSDFDFEAQGLILNALNFTPDVNIIDHHPINYVALISILKANPKLVNMDMVTLLLDKYEVEAVANYKGDIAKIIVNYLRANPTVEKASDFEKLLIDKLGKNNPDQILYLMRELIITNFEAINNFMSNCVTKSNNSNTLNNAIKFMLILPELQRKLNFQEHTASYGITLLNLLKGVKNPTQVASLLDNPFINTSDNNHQTAFVLNVIEELAKGKKFNEAIFTAIYNLSARRITYEDELTIFKYFLKTHLDDVMQEKGLGALLARVMAENKFLFDLNTQITLFENLDKNVSLLRDSEIQAAIKQLSQVLKEFKEIHDEFKAGQFNELNTRKENYREQDKEFYIAEGQVDGTVYIRYNNFAVVFEYNNPERLKQLFENMRNFGEIITDQLRGGGNLAHSSAIKISGLPEDFAIHITPYQITSDPQLNLKILNEVVYAFFNQKIIIKGIGEAEEYSDEIRHHIRKLATNNRDMEIALELDPIAESYYTLTSIIPDEKYKRIIIGELKNITNNSDYQRLIKEMDQAIPIINGKRVFKLRKEIKPDFELTLPKFLLSNKDYDEHTSIFRFTSQVASAAYDIATLPIEGGASDGSVMSNGRVTIVPTYKFNKEARLADHLVPREIRIKEEIMAILKGEFEVSDLINIKNNNPKHFAKALSIVLEDLFLLNTWKETTADKILMLLQCFKLKVTLPDSQQESILRDLITKFKQEIEESLDNKYLNIINAINEGELVFSLSAMENIIADNNDVFELKLD
jgi:hypothetical protein